MKLNRGYGADGLVQVDPQLVFNTPGWDEQLLDDIGDRQVSIENSVAVHDGVAYFTNSGGLVQGWDISGLADGRDARRRCSGSGPATTPTPSIVIDEEGFLYVACEYERGNARSRGGRPAPEARPPQPGRTRSCGRSPTTDHRPGGFWATPGAARRRDHRPRRRRLRAGLGHGDRRRAVGVPAARPDLAVTGRRRRRADPGRLRRRAARLRRVATRGSLPARAVAGRARRLHRVDARRCGTAASSSAPAPAASAPSATRDGSDVSRRPGRRRRRSSRRCR